MFQQIFSNVILLMIFEMKILLKLFDHLILFRLFGSIRQKIRYFFRKTLNLLSIKVKNNNLKIILLLKINFYLFLARRK